MESHDRVAFGLYCILVSVIYAVLAIYLPDTARALTVGFFAMMIVPAVWLRMRHEEDTHGDRRDA